MAFKSNKQNTFFKLNYFEAGVSKDEVNYIRTTNDDFSQKYKSIKDCWKSNSKYPQVATGRNHSERCVVVVDDDNRNIDQAFRNFRLLMFPMPNIIIENPKTHHTQSFYFLEKPVIIKKYSNGSVSNTKNYDKYKAVNDMMNSLAGDPHFTCWRCKNPYNENFEMIECKDEYYTIDELYKEVKHTYDINEILKESLNKNNHSHNIDMINKRSCKNEEIEKTHSSNKDMINKRSSNNKFTSSVIDGIEVRYESSNTSRNITLRQVCTSVLYDHRDWTEDKLIQYVTKNNSEISRLVSKTSLPENEVINTAHSAYGYFLTKKGKCSYNKDQQKNSRKISNILKIIRINKIRKEYNINDYSTYIDMINKRSCKVCDLANKYNITSQQVCRDKKLLGNIDALKPEVEEAMTFIHNAETCSNITNVNILNILENKNEVIELQEYIKEVK